MQRSRLTEEQRRILLRPINPARVLGRVQAGQRLHYLTQADVRAHLIRLFGFGNFTVDVRSVDTVFERERPTKDGKGTNYHVGVRAVVSLIIHATDATYTDTAVGESIGPNLGQVFDTATKSAVSDAMKRACTYLGDQFGLSLYFDGSVRPVVQITAVEMPAIEPDKTQQGKVPDADRPPGEGEHVGSEVAVVAEDEASEEKRAFHG